MSGTEDYSAGTGGGDVKGDARDPRGLGKCTKSSGCLRGKI